MSIQIKTFELMTLWNKLCIFTTFQQSQKKL